jgi:hypothetical protein
MEHHDDLHRRALRQAAALLLGAAALAALAAWARHRPDGVDDFKIAAGQLRSHSAELQLLAAEADRRLPPRFLRAHAGQLAHAVETTQQEVDALRPQPGLAPVKPPLQAVGRELAGAAQALQSHPRQPPAQAARPARTEALARAEQALQR